MPGKYSIELFREGGETEGVERVLATHNDLASAKKLFLFMVGAFPGRLIMLFDRPRVVSRSDRLATVSGRHE